MGDLQYGAGLLVWNSPSKMNYVFKGKTLYGTLGNYWGGSETYWTDRNKDGISDNSFSDDSYPLVVPFENYLEAPVVVEVEEWVMY